MWPFTRTQKRTYSLETDSIKLNDVLLSAWLSKGVIDLVVCIPMAATMGIGVPFCGVSLIVYESALSLAASVLGPLLTEAVIAEMAVTGSLLLFAVATNLLGLTDIKVANLLPSAFMPIALVPLMAMVTTLV